MADSYQVLKGKYQMALVSLRELEQERENLTAQLDGLRKSTAKMEKNTKYLCETILKKDREKKGETAWFKLALPEMVAEAQKSLENYFPSTEKLYRKLLQQQIDSAEEAHQKELKEQAAFKDEVISKLEEKLKTGRIDEEEIEKIVSDRKGVRKDLAPIDMDPGDTGDVSFHEEESDNLGTTVADAISPFVSAGQVVIPARSTPSVKNTEKTEDAVRKAVRDVQKEHADKAAAVAKMLTDGQRLTIRMMGETGYSAMPDLIAAGDKKFLGDPVKSRITSGMHSLIKKDKWKNGEWPGYLVEAVPCPLPGSANFVLYQLTQLGKDVYSYLFGKDAVESEMSMIIRNHSSVEHGYGIKRTAELMRDSAYVKKLGAEVIYMTRAKEFTVKVGEGKSYIPDIVIRYKGSNGREYREYFEYETGKCQGKDFTSKCNKMATFTRMLNFIVKDKDTKELLLKEFAAWKTEVLNAGFPFQWERPIECRVLTYAELKTQSNIGNIRQVEWTRVTISKPRKKEGAK